jgi:hypothetical protein
MTAEDRAVQRILEAACGYARLKGRHECKVSYKVGSGCSPVEWQRLKAVVAAAVHELTVTPSAEEGA